MAEILDRCALPGPSEPTIDRSIHSASAGEAKDVSYFGRLGIEIGPVALEPSQCSVGYCKDITGRGERAGLTDRPSIYLGPTVEIGRSSHSTVSRL